MVPRTFIILLASSLFLPAAPVSTGIWYEYSFDDPGFFEDPPNPSYVFATYCDSGTKACPGPPAGTAFAPVPGWSFTLADIGILRVTDVFLAGDIFDVYDGGIRIGTTSTVAADYAHNCDIDPAVCYYDPLMSSGQFLLAPGSHVITIGAASNPYGGGIGDFRVDETPEPGTLTLVGAALLVLTISRKSTARDSRDQNG